MVGIKVEVAVTVTTTVKVTVIGTFPSELARMCRWMSHIRVRVRVRVRAHLQVDAAH